jgi:hypothetical protein
VPQVIADGQNVGRDVIPLHADDHALSMRPRCTLESLLAQLAADSLHRELDAGAAMGSEIW